MPLNTCDKQEITHKLVLPQVKNNITEAVNTYLQFNDIPLPTSVTIDSAWKSENPHEGSMVRLAKFNLNGKDHTIPYQCPFESPVCTEVAGFNVMLDKSKPKTIGEKLQESYETEEYEDICRRLMTKGNKNSQCGIFVPDNYGINKRTIWPNVYMLDYFYNTIGNGTYEIYVHHQSPKNHIDVEHKFTTDNLKHKLQNTWFDVNGNVVTIKPVYRKLFNL